jgi:hypothetical protein
MRSNITNKKTYFLGGIILSLILAIGLIYFFLNHNKIPIPKAISREVKYTILYPQPSKSVLYDKTSFKYAKTQSILSFIIKFNNSYITFAEQSTPEPFNASTTFFSSFTQRLDSYATLNTTDGQVVLTLPPQTKEEIAVMNIKGTLLFASTKSKISETNWNFLFNTLQSVQPEV